LTVVGRSWAQPAKFCSVAGLSCWNFAPWCGWDGILLGQSFWVVGFKASMVALSAPVPPGYATTVY
jgi:hypothetical protein